MDDNGYTPTTGTEYFVMLGTNTGTFTSVLHNATADYSHSNETGVIGGAPATPTTTTVASTANPAVFGQPVSLTATVATSSGTPTGSVTFYDGATALGTQPVSTSERHDYRLHRDLGPARGQRLGHGRLQRRRRLQLEHLRGLQPDDEPGRADRFGQSEPHQPGPGPARRHHG